jgi:hypothetical protein
VKITRPGHVLDPGWLVRLSGSGHGDSKNLATNPLAAAKYHRDL